MNYLDLDLMSPEVQNAAALVTVDEASTPFEFVGGFDETQLLDLRHDVRRQRVAVLFDFRTGLWPLGVNAGVLVFSGVSQLNWDMDETKVESIAHMVLSTRLSSSHQGSIITFENIESTLSIRFSKAFLLAGSQPGSRMAIPDYSWPEAAIKPQLPNFDSGLDDMHVAVFSPSSI